MCCWMSGYWVHHFDDCVVSSWKIVKKNIEYNDNVYVLRDMK